MLKHIRLNYSLVRYQNNAKLRRRFLGSNLVKLRLSYEYLTFPQTDRPGNLKQRDKQLTC